MNIDMILVTISNNPNPYPNKASTRRELPVVVTSNSFVREAVRQVGPSVVRVDCEREISPLMTLLNPEAFREGDTIKVSGSGIVVRLETLTLSLATTLTLALTLTLSLAPTLIRSQTPTQTLTRTLTKALIPNPNLILILIENLTLTL
jgi:hypothetical protein